jgi:hypothetical protein
LGKSGYNGAMAGEARVICDLCGATIAPHAHYVVKIEVYADPSMPPLDTGELQEQDSERTMAELMAELKKYTADDLQDQVHRVFEYRICRACQGRFLANPLGKPRRERPPGAN